MFNNIDYKVSSIEKCLLCDEESHITDKYFKIYIPRLMPKIEFNAPEEYSKPSGSGLLGNDVSVDNEINLSNHLVSKSMTDYRSWMFGQIYKMSHSDSGTETEFQEGDDGSSFIEPKFPVRLFPDVEDPFDINGVSRPEDFIHMPIVIGLHHMDLNAGHVGGAPHLPKPHDEHSHPINKPFQFFNVKYEELNDIKINRGKQMIGCFVSGDLNDFRISHIPGVIPQRGD